MLVALFFEPTGKGLPGYPKGAGNAC